jgi:predicted O-methyltransferase YrrM
MKTFLHACKFFIGLDAPYSQVTEEELSLLLEYSHSANIIVEIGCFEGKTTASLARNSKGMVYSIDPFFQGRLGISYGKWIAQVHFRRQHVRNIQLLKGTSDEVIHSFPHKIDFLFIDADHAYEAIKRDWENWVPRVNNGGMVALHDCKIAINSPDYLGSMKFYDEDIPFIKGIEQVATIDSLVIFRVKR